MIILRRTDTCGARAVVFDGMRDVRKFFFFYENAILASRIDEEKLLSLLGHLDGDAFDFYYNTSACNGELKEGASNYISVRQRFFSEFIIEKYAHGVISQPSEAILDIEDIPESLKET